MSTKRVPLVHGPTPIVHRPALDELVGCEVWIKRDDATGGAEAGNKIRKLEFLLAEALYEKATVVVTCGGTQSNHARATALACASLGIKCALYLRQGDVEGAGPLTGNVLLDRLAGAEIRPITPAEYKDRARLLQRAAEELSRAGERPYVIPEGGSNGLGALGYVEAMREVRAQLDMGLCGPKSAGAFHAVAHACGSGGTAAGVALGAARFGVAKEAWAFAVCDDRAYFERTIGRIVAEARSLDPSLDAQATLVVDDRAKGPAYAATTEEQRSFIVRVARASGIVLDPVYTGKAMFGLAHAVARGAVPRGARVLFLHTGGLPGLLAQGHTFEGLL